MFVVNSFISDKITFYINSSFMANKKKRSKNKQSPNRSQLKKTRVFNNSNRKMKTFKNR